MKKTATGKTKRSIQSLGSDVPIFLPEEFEEYKGILIDLKKDTEPGFRVDRHVVLGRGFELPFSNRV